MHKTRIKFIWLGLNHVVTTNPTPDRALDHNNANIILKRLLTQGATIVSVRPLVKR
jgi:hypothetical protein